MNNNETLLHIYTRNSKVINVISYRIYYQRNNKNSKQQQERIPKKKKKYKPKSYSNKNTPHKKQWAQTYKIQVFLPTAKVKWGMLRAFETFIILHETNFLFQPHLDRLHGNWSMRQFCSFSCTYKSKQLNNNQIHK